jgi:hypothetical protein
MQSTFLLRPSRYLALALIVAHGAAYTALLPLTLPVWAKAALAPILLCSLIFHLRREAWLSAPDSCIAMKLEGDQVTLTTRIGAEWAGTVSSNTLVTPFLTVLNVMPQGARFSRSVIIMQGSLDRESFRQLRVSLKWGQ